MKRFLEIAFVVIVGIVLLIVPKNIKNNSPWSNGFNNNFSCNTDITKMYEGYVEQWKKDIAYSFNEAEKEVYGSNPTPDIVGPHPDPKKCICKGSGVIKQGDGHTTPCPYHGSKFVKPLIILEK